MRTYEETQYWDLYHLFMSKDLATTQLHIREFETIAFLYTELVSCPHQHPLPQPSPKCPMQMYDY